MVAMVKIEVPLSMVKESIQKVVDFVVKSEVERQLVDNEAFQAYIHNEINAEVQAQAPGNVRIQKVIEEVREHLDRYPAIADDIGLQNAVGQAVFTYLQGKPWSGFKR